MEAASFLCSPKTHFSPLTPRHFTIYANVRRKTPLKNAPFLSSPSPSLITSPLRAVAEVLEQATATCHTHVAASRVGPHSNIDKSGRFCSPRAARELALMISYAACLEGTDPIQLFDMRVNAKRVPGFQFDKKLLLKYNHMIFGEAPIEVETEEEAQELIRQDERDSDFGTNYFLNFICTMVLSKFIFFLISPLLSDADVLSAPVKLVYSNFVLRYYLNVFVLLGIYEMHPVYLFADKLWGICSSLSLSLSLQNEAASRIIELCILHIAMAEITSMKTKHQIVINEAVDLAKQFCDGRAPRIINGCLRTFVKQRSEQGSEADRDADDSKREDLTQSETMQEEKIRL
ncbi:N utilization substance protein B [Carex littledalei]|uniref:N utilization substance protein B n=1 Tax=Carex littledalei TaxID=544730 RepID=A0A833R1M8_9POAL|nr:N utilization substance protein B [Carex littledalei]